MGIFNSDYPGHEGHIVGFVTREGVSAGSGIYRELGYPDQEERVVERVAAACECGWRSAHWTPSERTEYGPYCVFDSERDHDRMVALWQRHLEQDVAAAVVLERFMWSPKHGGCIMHQTSDGRGNWRDIASINEGEYPTREDGERALKRFGDTIRSRFELRKVDDWAVG